MSDISGKTKVLALIGRPVEHSLSPLIHNLSCRQLGLDYVYVSFEVEENGLGDAVKGMKALGVRGFNVTMPYKQKVMDYLDEISDTARMIGAVNTVVNRDGSLVGYNTDGSGYVQSLAAKGVEVEGKKAVMVGAGGAAKSVAVELALQGVKELVVVNRTPAKAYAITDTIKQHMAQVKVRVEQLHTDRLAFELQEAGILINCTPLGMDAFRDKSIIEDPQLLPPGLVVSDLIYYPAVTRLLRIARQRGCKTINGLGMLIWQGAHAFELWTGRRMPVDLVEARLVEVAGV